MFGCDLGPNLTDNGRLPGNGAAAEDILNEGLRYLPNAETLQRQGRPEREIVFVVDHAPCPVLLVRALARDQFPIAR